MTATASFTERTEPTAADLTQGQTLLSNSNLNETKADPNSHLLPSRFELLDTRKRIKKGAFEGSDSMNDLVAFELEMMSNRRGAMKRTRFGKANRTLNEDGTASIPDNQATLDLLEKIRQSSSGLAVGQAPVSQKVSI